MNANPLTDEAARLVRAAEERLRNETPHSATESSRGARISISLAMDRVRTKLLRVALQLDRVSEAHGELREACNELEDRLRRST